MSTRLHGGDAEAGVTAQFERYARTRDVDLRNRLVEDHLGLAEFHARRYASVGIARDDMTQVARLAIIGAVSRFDPARGVSFATFANRTIQGECQRFLRDRTWTVRPPRSLQESYLAVQRAHGGLTQQLGRPPTATDLASVLGITEHEVNESLQAGSARFSLTIESRGEPDDEVARRSPLDERSVDLDRDGTAYDAVDLRLALTGAIARLNEREQEIVRLRFDDGWTESQIATAVGVSQSYLSRCLKKILLQLRSMLEERTPEVAI